tara:strand:+ start:277 stop:534 length:258 start_codon:yes stop_codon:yes gene_type:complete
MKLGKRYQKGDKVLVKSFAGPDVRVLLKSRYIVSETDHKLGVDGWNAQIVNKKEVDKLRQHGVPYSKNEKPVVWVFDWQIIKKCD